MRKRSYAAITTAVIAVSLVALYATGATGAGPHRAGPHIVTFKTIDQTVDIHFADNSPGDSSIPLRQTRPTDVIVAHAESMIGKTKVADVYNHCEFVTNEQAQCQATWRFNGKKGTRRGSITAAGVLDFGSEHEISRAPIVGGTGRVRGIRGEITRTTAGTLKDQVVFKILDE
jgi:hypothetical protein